MSGRVPRRADRGRRAVAVARATLGALLISAAGSGCENYSSPALDAQGALNERFHRGEISRAEYRTELARLRAAESSTTAPPERAGYSQTF